MSSDRRVHVFRLLTRQPGFTVAALLTLALGIGAPTAIFAIVHSVLLRPLPYTAPDQLVTFRVESETPRGPIGVDAFDVSTALEWGSTTRTLAGLALYNDAARTVQATSGPVRMSGLSATPNLFELLGTAPALGQTFTGADRDRDQVVLSHTAWRQHFAGDPAVVGRVIVMDGRPHRVTGVMPERFQFPRPETEFWVPVILNPGGSRGMLLPAIGRITHGGSRLAVEDEGQQLLDSQSDERISRRLIVRTVQDQMVGPVRQTLWIFMAAVSLASAVATVNVALLLLAQGVNRRREFSLRLALGAPRRRLFSQLCVEGLALAAMGGAIGLLVAVLTTSAIIHFAPAGMPRLHETTFDGPVFLFVIVLVIATTLIFSLIAAGRVLAGDALHALLGTGGESRLHQGGATNRRFQAMVAAELALAMVLLTGAGTLMQSFVRQLLVDQGFDTRDRVAMQFTMPTTRYPSPEARMAFVTTALDAARAVPGVASAAVVTAMPNRQPTARQAYDPVGFDPFADPWARKLAEVRMTTPGALTTLGVPLLAGRDIAVEDTESTELVIVISQAFAKAHFADEDPVGRMLYSPQGDRRIVGVVGNVLPAVLGLPQYDPSVYIPLRQSIDVFQQFGSVSMVVRGRPQITAIRAAITEHDPAMAVFNVRTMSDEVARLVAGPRFSASVVGVFAVIALVMAVLGVYGVTAYSTARRTREIGVRVALGATPRHVTRTIVLGGGRMVIAGLTIGALGIVAVDQLLAAWLAEVGQLDIRAAVGVGLLLTLSGLVAVYVPARRAASLDPLHALRED